MAAIGTLPVVLATGDHASRPAASAVGIGALYSCTTHSLVYQTNGSTWSTWATLGATLDFGEAGDIGTQTVGASASAGSTGEVADAGHVHPLAAPKLDDLATPDDNTDLDATTGHHGLLPKLGGGTANYLRADGSWAAPSGAAGAAEHAYYQNLAALLDPDALEPVLTATGSGSLAAATAATKWIISAWRCAFGGTTGRFDFREPGIGPIPVYNKAIHALAADATLLLLDPSIPDFAGAAREAYFDRLNDVTTMEMLYVPIEGGAAKVPFIPGPYGSLILGISVHDAAWIAICGPRGTGTALTYHNEKGDASTDDLRTSQRLYVPTTKAQSATLILGAGGGPDNVEGGLLYVNLPSSWSTLTDTNTYLARADLLTRSIAGWDVATNGAGSVGIWTPSGGDSQSAVAIKGTGAAWSNGFQHPTTFDRAANRTVEWYVRIADDSTNAPNVMVGIGDGGTFSGDTTLDGDMAYAVDFTNPGSADRRLFVFEGGSSRGAVGPNPGYAAGSMYRVKIVLAADGSADYFIQGGVEHPAIGSASWTDITPGTSANAQSTGFKLAAIVNGSQTQIVSDGKAYDPA